jgi:hypothetical protein
VVTDTGNDLGLLRQEYERARVAVKERAFGHVVEEHAEAAIEVARKALIAAERLAAAVAEDAAGSKSRWISVAERIPSDCEHVLICEVRSGRDYIYTGYYDHVALLWAGEDTWVDSGDDRFVTHWMPLPAPPQRPRGVRSVNGADDDEWL